MKSLCSYLHKTYETNWFQSVVLLAIRLWLAKVFFLSGLTKIKSWSTTLMLFESEYDVPVIPHDIAAFMATGAELVLPVLLILGLMTPFAAFGLLIMTLVIELLVYPGFNDHYHWMLLFTTLIAFGAGKLSVDNWIQNRNCKK